MTAAQPVPRRPARRYPTIDAGVDLVRASLAAVTARLEELGAHPEDPRPFEAAGRLGLLVELERGRVRLLEAAAHLRHR